MLANAKKNQAGEPPEKSPVLTWDAINLDAFRFTPS